jgi:hypothetical protein
MIRVRFRERRGLDMFAMERAVYLRFESISVSKKPQSTRDFMCPRCEGSPQLLMSEESSTPFTIQQFSCCCGIAFGIVARETGRK